MLKKIPSTLAILKMASKMAAKMGKIIEYGIQHLKNVANWKNNHWDLVPDH